MKCVSGNNFWSTRHACSHVSVCRPIHKIKSNYSSAGTMILVLKITLHQLNRALFAVFSVSCQKRVKMIRWILLLMYWFWNVYVPHLLKLKIVFGLKMCLITKGSVRSLSWFHNRTTSFMLNTICPFYYTVFHQSSVKEIM